MAITPRENREHLCCTLRVRAASQRRCQAAAYVKRRFACRRAVPQQYVLRYATPTHGWRTEGRGVAEGVARRRASRRPRASGGRANACRQTRGVGQWCSAAHASPAAGANAFAVVVEMVVAGHRHVKRIVCVAAACMSPDQRQGRRSAMPAPRPAGNVVGVHMKKTFSGEKNRQRRRPERYAAAVLHRRGINAARIACTWRFRKCVRVVPAVPAHDARMADSRGKALPDRRRALSPRYGEGRRERRRWRKRMGKALFVLRPRRNATCEAVARQNQIK